MENKTTLPRQKKGLSSHRHRAKQKSRKLISSKKRAQPIAVKSAFPARVPITKKTHSEWREITIGEDAHIFVSPLSEEIVKRMPTSTKTFVERSIVDVVMLKTQKLLEKRRQTKTDLPFEKIKSS